MQRKRHINFKDFLSTSGSTLNLGQRIEKSKLHSIPTLLLHNRSSDKRMKNNLKSNVLYSIPCSCILALLLVGITTLANSNSCFATTSASLSISTPNMSTVTDQGTTAIVNTKVNVNVSGAKDYSLILKLKEANLTNGATIIKPGNVTADNTWGYKWNQDSDTTTYKSPSTTGTVLSTPALSNGAANFEGTLTFAARFASNAETGSYKNEGSILLTTTPGAITLSSINDMQEMTSEICAKSSIEETKQLRDTRDGKLYWVAKLKDNNCWMVQNLDYDVPGVSITTTVPTGGSDMPSIYDPGLKVVSGNSFVDAGSNDTHLLVGNFYSLNTATDGSSNSTVGGIAPKSICANGWRLPTGGTAGEYAALVNSVSASALAKAPYYYVLGGYGQKTQGACDSDGGCQYSYNFKSIGDRAGYWTASGSIPYWYSMNISATEANNVNENRGIWMVYNIRCIAE